MDPEDIKKAIHESFAKGVPLNLPAEVERVRQLAIDKYLTRSDGREDMICCAVFLPFTGERGVYCMKMTEEECKGDPVYGAVVDDKYCDKPGPLCYGLTKDSENAARGEV